MDSIYKCIFPGFGILGRRRKKQDENNGEENADKTVETSNVEDSDAITNIWYKKPSLPLNHRLKNVKYE